MIAYNCPLNRVICDGCDYLNANDCCVLAYQSYATSITQEEKAELWERRKEELMKLSKDDLIELIIGRKPI